VTRATQAVVLTLLGACLLGLTLSDKYLDYVRPWTRIPLIICGVLMVASSITHLLRRPTDLHGSDLPRISWLLLVPVVVILVAKPPQLGAYLAERQANQLPPRTKLDLPTITASAPVELGIFEFTQVEAYDKVFLRNIKVNLIGFVSYDSHGNWYITRLSTTCCAADAVASRVRVIDAPMPPRNTWIRLIGASVDSHIEGESRANPAVQAISVTKISAPRDPYEH
jgi:uncharacterized repeat protein (TIGR03943 family)